MCHSSLKKPVLSFVVYIAVDFDNVINTAIRRDIYIGGGTDGLELHGSFDEAQNN